MESRFQGPISSSKNFINEPEIKKTKIYVASFDMDGCVLHKKTTPPTELIPENKLLIEAVSEEINTNNYDKAYALIGSNRQSYKVDFANARNNPKGSCFPILGLLCEAINDRLKVIKITIDPYLLADTFGKKAHGENFNKAIEGWEYGHDQDEYLYSDWFFDESKITLLYTQIHKLASENPKAHILFHFYDDRTDINKGLINFINANPDLLPINVELKIHLYSGSDLSLLTKPTLQGRGEVDVAYQETLYKMIEFGGFSYPREDAGHVLQYIAEKESLEKLKKWREINIQTKLMTPEKMEVTFSQETAKLKSEIQPQPKPEPIFPKTVTPVIPIKKESIFNKATLFGMIATTTAVLAGTVLNEYFKDTYRK